jgi:hypothetical protein
MAINLGDQLNIDKSDLANYPNGQIQDNDGTDNGTPINRVTSSDLWMFFDKLMRNAALSYNGNFDNEGNGYQYIDALMSLASKSDYVLSLTTTGGGTPILNINTRLGILQTNEKLLALAVSDYTSETQITGTDSPVVTKSIIITQQWKAGDYLLLVNTPSGIKIIQEVNGDNINTIVAANNFLKAANNVVTLAGTATNAAVTPASLLYAFQQRLNDGTNAAPFFADSTKPGIISAATYDLIANFNNPVKNVGWFSGVNPGSGTVGSFATRSGNITQAQITGVQNNPGGSTTYRVTMQNAMANTNYYVRFMLQSEGTLTLDNDCLSPVFQIVSTTQFDFSINQAPTFSSTVNLKVHCEVVQI